MCTEWIHRCWFVLNDDQILMYEVQEMVHTTSSIKCWWSTEFQYVCGYTQSNVCCGFAYTLMHTFMRCENHVKSWIHDMCLVCAWCLRHTYTYWKRHWNVEYLCERAYVHIFPVARISCACVSVWVSVCVVRILETIHILKKNLLCKWLWKGFDFSFHISSRLFYYHKPIKLTILIYANL